MFQWIRFAFSVLFFCLSIFHFFLVSWISRFVFYCRRLCSHIILSLAQFLISLMHIRYDSVVKRTRKLTIFFHCDVVHNLRVRISSLFQRIWHSTIFVFFFVRFSLAPSTEFALNLQWNCLAMNRKWFEIRCQWQHDSNRFLSLKQWKKNHSVVSLFASSLRFAHRFNLIIISF